MANLRGVQRFNHLIAVDQPDAEIAAIPEPEVERIEQPFERDRVGAPDDRVLVEPPGDFQGALVEVRQQALAAVHPELHAVENGEPGRVLRRLPDADPEIHLRRQPARQIAVDELIRVEHDGVAIEVGRSEKRRADFQVPEHQPARGGRVLQRRQWQLGIHVGNDVDVRAWMRALQAVDQHANRADPIEGGKLLVMRRLSDEGTEREDKAHGLHAASLRPHRTRPRRSSVATRRGTSQCGASRIGSTNFFPSALSR
jgi:hypothetical protein